MEVMELLTVYEQASGKKVNRQKSTVFFSANVIPYNKELIYQELQIKEAVNSSKISRPAKYFRKKQVGGVSLLKRKGEG